MKQLKCYFPFIILLFLLNNSFAQSIQDGNTRDGFLVKFKRDVPHSDIKALSFLKTDTGIYEGEHFEHLDIWYIRYDSSQITKSEALQTLRNDPTVLRANPIRKVEYRFAHPDDNYFSDQWALNNRGQTGGTPGADMKALKAWEITRGNTWGTHEPVLAVIDNGFDQSHEDLEFLSGGYDAYNDDFTIPTEVHGTHTSGILGAKGNNENGIVGVNWDARIFPVAGLSADEFIVVRAYDHILGLRKLYNSSGGTQGQYIVATNSSFGVDFGNPNNFSDWCAAYDSLGIHGIINIASTANLNMDVEIYGDVPTRCDSNYLIAVTSTDHNDNRDNGAAYGSTSIDLGAPGTNILSTVPSAYGTYSSGTGTSAAAPHVTGVVGLIYSVFSNTTISNSFTNPGGTALYVKDLILDNVDQISSMSGITTTGGRLNAYKAVKAALPVYNNHSFTSNMTMGYARLTGNSSISGGVTLTIPSGKTVVLDGSLSGASGSTISVASGGGLIIESNAALTGVHIAVASGGVLDVKNQANLKFASGQGITAYGKVTIDNATLQKQGAPRWAGLTLQGSGADGSSITYSTIKGSVNGVQIVGADDTWIWQNVIEDHQNNGMYVSSTNGTEIGWTTFRDNGGNGLVTDFSDVHFGIYNRFQDNTGDGLLADGSSFLHFGGVGDPGGAVFRGNRYGVYAKSLSWVHLGEDNYPYANTGGNNSIYWNLTKEVRVDMGSNVKAQLTWWGTSSPSAALFEDNPPFSVVDWSSWLTVAPVTKMAVDLPPELFSEASEAPIISDADGHAAATVWQRLSAAGDRRIETLHALMQDTELSRAASLISLGEYLRSGNFAMLHTQAERMLNAPGLGGQEQAHILKARFMAYLLEDNISQARATLNELTKGEESGQMATLAALLPDGETSGGEVEPPGSPYALQAASYPNPFNPVTTISYTLPARSHVNLVVYDLLGREVAHLVNEVRQAGPHTVQFDASALSSGVYLYRLTAGQHVLTHRITLIK